VRCPDVDSERSNDSAFTLVVDESGRPVEVPDLAGETDRDRDLRAEGRAAGE